MSAKSWSLHACLLDRECRRVDAPPRLYVNTPRGSLVVALWRGGSSQLWLPWKTRDWHGQMANWSRWWSPIAWHPRHRSE